MIRDGGRYGAGQRSVAIAVMTVSCWGAIAALGGVEHGGLGSQAAEVRNTATADGANLPNPITSNTAVFTAEPAQLELIKTADRASAEPGDTAVYRLVLRNTGSSTADQIVLTDQLPLGINVLPESVQSVLTRNGQNQSVTSTVSTDQRQIIIRYPELKAGETLTILYAAVLTPDSIRGTGRNVAQEARSNVATYVLNIRPGILSDCGTLIGRVFEDRNFDGEQQPGEPGIPNAVIFLDNGNRITTDPDGLFSMANVLAGDRLGTLDLTSVPGYTIAPNRYFIERNSLARLVRLEPGGLARMNFGVTPLAESEG